MDFNYIKKFDCNNVPTFKLKRSLVIQNSYDEHYKTNFFIDFKSKVTDMLKTNPFYITENSYPYEFIDNTKHFLIWFSNNDIDFKKIIEHYFKIDSKNYTYFENLENNKSIKEIRHKHVFINYDN